jgi:regulator of protease activity HflC (stomatin/prohibitin superfamily)
VNPANRIGREKEEEGVGAADKAANLVEEFLARVGKTVNENVHQFGVNIQQFGLIVSLRPPQALLEAINSKTQAIQKSIQIENEVHSAQAEACHTVLIIHQNT